MIFIIDGLQSVGKTTLINALNYNSYKFKFVDYLHEFDLSSPEELNAFQIGKDLGMLFGLNLIQKESDIIIDRGPLSSAFYSIQENRKLYSTNLLIKFFKEIYEFKNIRYIWIDKINDNTKQKRNRKDGFDYLEGLEDIFKLKICFKILENTSNIFNVKINFFQNDFSKSIKENANNLNELIKRIKNEH